MNIDPPEIFEARILIVDDQPANVQLLQQLLERTGYANVTATTNACEVALRHRHHPYDLILLDLQMPGMSGFEVMKALQANLAEGYLPVIVITAQPEHKLRALRSGAKDFISKPFDLVEVTSRVRNLLEVRLLYKRLEDRSTALEQTVHLRTAELRESEARASDQSERAGDWYWEQSAGGTLTKVSGPVEELLGGGFSTFLSRTSADGTLGWNESERVLLQAKIAARQPFVDFKFSRVRSDGSTQSFRLSGEPMFDPARDYVGYRGVGSALAAGG